MQYFIVQITFMCHSYSLNRCGRLLFLPDLLGALNVTPFFFSFGGSGGFVPGIGLLLFSDEMTGGFGGDIESDVVFYSLCFLGLFFLR